MSVTLSPNQKAIQRLKKNKPALFGLGLIVLSIVVAILGYGIAPDDTPDTNNQLTTIALKSPGFKVKILKLLKSNAVNERGFLGKMLFGSETKYNFLLINSFEIVGDSLIVEKYAGENPETGALLKGRREAFSTSIFMKNNEKTAQNTEGVKKYISERRFYLGTDNFGRDTLSRLILGVRVSLMVGLIAVIISLTIGILMGAMGGYFGGRIDDVIMLVMNTIWSIPTILLVFAIVLAFGRGIGIIFLAVGLTMWVDVARLVRGQVMSLKEMNFVEAAQSMGFSTTRILMRHILPNILGPVMVVAASNFATAILIESGLSYLGFGIQPPTPSWGTMLNENYGYAIGGKPFLALIPALAIMLMVLAFNLVGNGFRDALDVKSKD
jgi:ABC-type dipeptide/oligopeptide/nickel transport system permease subunit